VQQADEAPHDTALTPHCCAAAAPDPLPLGQFDEKLGNGAFKEVYLSYDTETGKEVAW